MDTYLLTVPEQPDFDIFLHYQEHFSNISDDKKIVVDFQLITQVDYSFLHNLMSIKYCFVSCLNEVKFINFSEELSDFFNEAQLKQFLNIPNLIH